MEFLSDDPTYLAGGLGLLAGVFLIATKLTQQGKYFLWAAVSLALALAVVAVEKVWVTDNERVEDAIYGLARAVETSDAPGVLDRMTADVQYVVGGNSMSSDETRKMIALAVGNSKFDFLRISALDTSAGGQSRRGHAEFRVLCSGSFRGAYNTQNFGTAASAWSLGLRETSPGVWKVNRITPVSLPGHQSVLPSAFFRPEPAPAPAMPTAGPPPPRRRGFGRRSAMSEFDNPYSTPARWEP